MSSELEGRPLAQFLLASAGNTAPGIVLRSCHCRHALMSAFSYRVEAGLLATVSLLLTFPLQASEPKWLQISSSHFLVITDAGPKKGHEVAARFEQMRGVFSQLMMRQKIRMSQPIEILALQNPATYGQVAPQATGLPS